MRSIFMIVGIMTVIAPMSVEAQSFISGRVRSPSGVALEGMIVRAYNLSGVLIANEVTRSDGTYTLSVSAATYKVLAYDPSGNLATSFYLNASSFETASELSVATGSALRNIDFNLEKGYFLSGVVRGPPGADLSKVFVAAYNLNGTRRGFQKVSPTGTYSLVLPAGTYKVAVYDEKQFLATEFFNDKHAFETAETIVISGPFRVDFTPVPGGRVSGRVTDRALGTPIEGLQIYALDLDGRVVGSTTTNLDGRYSMVLPPGTFKLFASDPDEKYAIGYLGDTDDFESSPTISVAAGTATNGLSFAVELADQGPDPVITRYIPVAASTPGSGGTYFRTDVWIQNPNPEALEVSVTFMPPPVEGLVMAVTNVITVGARSQRYLGDVLANEFDYTGGGALALESNRIFAATSRTYNDPTDSELGTAGLSVPAQAIVSSLSRAVITGLANNSDFRSNVGVFNPGPNTIDVTYELYDGDGSLLGEVTRSFVSREWLQANTIFAFLGQAATQSDHAYLVLSSEQGSFFSYGSVVDGRSGDATLILPAATPVVE